MSLVQAHKISKDPRNLSYLFPSMPLHKYKKATDHWYKLKCIKAIEDVAETLNLKAIPAEVIHWARKNRFVTNRVEFLGRAFYIISLSDLTKAEIKRYEDLIL